MFYANMDDNLRIQCRVCKGFAPASQFKLHYKYKQVVCQNCTSGKFEQEERKKAAAVAAPAEQRKPAGWDKEDEYLEKMARLKRQSEPQTNIEKIPGSNLVKLGCFKCAYKFKYDPYKKMPHNCPYCNVEVPNLKLYNL